VKAAKAKYYLKVENGSLTDDDFVGDAPALGSSDKRYSKEELEAFKKLAVELEALKAPAK